MLLLLSGLASYTTHGMTHTFHDLLVDAQEEAAFLLLLYCSSHDEHKDGHACMLDRRMHVMLVSQ